MFSTCVFVHLFVRYQSWEHDMLTLSQVVYSVYTDETINIWNQEVKGQGHTTLTLDMQTWSIGREGFSSFVLSSYQNVSTHNLECILQCGSWWTGG